MSENKHAIARTRRPAGASGHFRVPAGNKSYECVGDVSGKTVAPCTTTGALCADLSPLAANTVTLPDRPVDAASGNPDIAADHATGVMFNGTATRFVIPQTPSAPTTITSSITAGAKFLFATNFDVQLVGPPPLIAGIRGMTFGNGDTPGDADALHAASAPDDEADGLFGVPRYQAP